MKTLVFGSNGYLGRHLTHAAQNRLWDVRTTDIQPCSWNEDSSYISCDIRDIKALQHNLDWDVDFVMIFGGLSGTIDSFENFADYIDVNIKGLLGILETIRCTGSGAKVVFPSSRLVYRGQPDRPLKENDTKQVNTIYAATKLAAENYLQMYERVFDLRFTVFRICVPYGNIVGSGYSYGTMEFLLRSAVQGKDIHLYGDGMQQRTFSHIEDICEQIMTSITLQQSDGASLNVDGGDNVSLAEAASLVAKRYGVSVHSVRWPELNLRCETGDAVFDTTAIRKLTKYTCRHTLKKWLENENCGD